MRHVLCLLTIGVALTGCEDATRLSSEAGPAASRDASSGPHADAGLDGCAQRLECIGAPLGCHYQGGDGCSSCGTIVCDGGMDASPDGALDAASDAHAPDSGVDGARADASFACGSNDFPSFDRSCTAPEECVVVEHQINCCGTLRATAIRMQERERFEQAEASCRAGYPACECAQQATQADDGTISEDGQAARALCLAGVCTSTFAAASGDVCTPGQDACEPGYSCCYPCGIPDCTFRCEPTCAEGTPGCANGCLLRP